MALPRVDQFLTQRLRVWFSPGGRGDADEEDRLPRGWVIAICLLISVVLWFTLSMRETYTRMLPMPTDIATLLTSLPEDVALANMPPATVQVQVRGEGFQLLKLWYDPPVIPIDPNQDEIVLEDASLDLPNNVVLESVSPRVFNLQKEERITRQIPIQLRASIETAPTSDFLGPIRLRPDSIVVSGARSLVESLDYWPTVRFSRRDLQDSLVVEINLADTLSGLVRRSHDSTILTAIASTFTEGSRNLEITVTGVPSSQTLVSLEPSILHVRYRVPISLYEQAEHAPDFFATVSYDVIRADTTGYVRPILNLPSNILLRDVIIEPAVVGYFERLVD